jgi:hypothetical protein
MVSQVNIEVFSRLEAEFVCGVDLPVSGAHLAAGVFVHQDAVPVAEALLVFIAKVFGWDTDPMTRSPKSEYVTEERKATLLPPALISCVVCLFSGSRGPAHHSLGLEEEGVARREEGSFGMEVHHAAEGIAAVHGGTRSEDDLGSFYDVRVNGNDVLNVAFTVDGIIHPYAVNVDEHPVGGKAPEHRASAAELALLHKDIAPRETDQLQSADSLSLQPGVPQR